MAYKALYRSYRPQVFSEVVGQEMIVKTLQNAIKNNKVAHAYLFCGPRGTGKTTMAKIFAKALNCVEGPTENPCGICKNCQGIANGTISDVIEIDAASNNGADDIRRLRDSVKFLPSECRYKVYIIDEVHMLSNSAFNALLKTLEEPPLHVIFILATTEPYKLPNTILSRCQRFDFKGINQEGIIKRLKEVADKEQIKIKDEAISLIATSASGGMRDALSMLDQVISYANNEVISEEDVLTISGNVSSKDLLDLISYSIEHKEVDAINLVERLTKNKEIPTIISDLVLFLKDILLFKANSLELTRPIFKSEEFLLLEKNLTNNLIYHYIDILNEAYLNMRYSNQKKAFLDLAILKLADTRLTLENTLLDRLERLELRLNDVAENANNQVVKKTTLADLKQFEEVNEEALTKIEVNNNYITIKMINDILNNGDKEIKKNFIAKWNDFQIKYQDTSSMQMFFRGSVVAASKNALIVVLKDNSFCNRVMRYENYIKILEVLQLVNKEIQAYYAISNNIWLQIMKDYQTKYKNGALKPILNDIIIPVSLPNREAISINTEIDDIENSLKEAFGDLLEIKEE